MTRSESVPCVSAPRSAGEETRQALAEAALLDTDHQIAVEGDRIYVPVTDVEAVPDRFETTHREMDRRDRPESPAEILGFEPTIERLGDIVIVDEDDPERAAEIAEAVVASHVPARTILNRASPIEGELRVRSWDVLYESETADDVDSVEGDDADRPATETVHREYGHEFEVDIASVYFSPRLATERHRVTAQIAPGEHVVDMFAGVGPFAIPAAAAGAEVVAVDLNAAAIEYLRRNAERNGVADRVTAVHGDVREVGTEWEGWADRIVMNLPHSAADFLETAIRLAGSECVIHYYDIQSDADPFGPGIAAIREAAGDDYEVTVETERVVRSYAPHEENVCLDVRLRAIDR
ncbi:MAG: class I SAM-dependent methyltransferase [Halobacteriota archaeon]